MDIGQNGLRTSVYKVPDLNAAKEWYTTAFGVKPYFDEPFYVGFNIAGYELGLLEDATPADAKTANTYAYWAVEDIHSEFTRLLDCGATSLEEPTNVGGDLMVAAVRDPWGNAIGMIYNPYFKLD